MSKFVDGFRKLIDKLDPMPNSKMTAENTLIKTLAPWCRKACNDIKELEAKTPPPCSKTLNQQVKSLKDKIAGLEADNARLDKRDGNAEITLCYDNGSNPFAREDCKIVDFGVSGNCYVIEIPLVEEMTASNKSLKDKIAEVEGERKLWELRVDEAAGVIETLELKLKRYDQAAKTPFIKGGNL